MAFASFLLKAIHYLNNADRSNRLKLEALHTE